MSCIFTIPKAGTHFMKELLNELNIPIEVKHRHSNPNKKNTLFYISPSAIGNNNVAVIRDLRDKVCSSVSWLEKRSNAQLSTHPEANNYKNSSPDEKLLQCIKMEGLSKGHMITTLDCCHFVIDLMKRADTFVLRFEDFIGPQAGGHLTEEERVSLLKKMCSHIGHPRSNERINSALQNIWGQSVTYNTVQKKVGRWKQMFNQDHKEAFMNIWNGINVSLGYSALASKVV